MAPALYPKARTKRAFVSRAPASIVIAERAFLHPPETAMQIARVTMPSVPITNAAFVYRNKDCTNVTLTWDRHRQNLQAQQAQAREVVKTRKRPAVMTVRRVRAGTTGHLSMPLFEEAVTC